MRDVRKTGPLLHCKALGGDDPPGTFEAIVSSFGNEDSDGEAVPLGAFTDTLKSGLPPITYSHQWILGDLPIGKTVDAEELDRAALLRLVPDGVPDNVTGGLYAKGKLHVDGEFAIDRAKAAYRNLLEGSLREFSFGGKVDPGDVRVEKRANRRPLVWLERIAEWVEWGPCMKGANGSTHLLGVKSTDQLRAELGLPTLDDVAALKASVDRLYDRLNPTSDAPGGGNTWDPLLVVAGCPIPDSKEQH